MCYLKELILSLGRSAQALSEEELPISTLDEFDRLRRRENMLAWSKTRFSPIQEQGTATIGLVGNVTGSKSEATEVASTYTVVLHRAVDFGRRIKPRKAWFRMAERMMVKEHIRRQDTRRDNTAIRGRHSIKPMMVQGTCTEGRLAQAPLALLAQLKLVAAQGHRPLHFDLISAAPGANSLISICNMRGHQE